MKKYFLLLPVTLFFFALMCTGAVVSIPTAHAAPWLMSSHVETAVTDNGNGTWSYEYVLFNDSEDLEESSDISTGMETSLVWEEPYVRDWELPWFGDAGIVDIADPEGWYHSIETVGVINAATGWDGVAAWQDLSDPWYQGPDSPYTSVTQVLHWWTDVADEEVTFSENWIAPLADLGGFSFTAAYDETAAPYQASWAFLDVQTGDPGYPNGGGLPNSPLTNPVPEPATMLLLGGGLIGLAAFRKKFLK